jgi:hypothetical protein
MSTNAPQALPTVEILHEPDLVAEPDTAKSRSQRTHSMGLGSVLENTRLPFTPGTEKMENVIEALF